MDNIHDTTPPTNYALNGKIMLCSVVILFTVVCVVVFFHSYARWCTPNRSERRRIRRLRRHHQPNNIVVSSQGLDLSILKALPTFVYSSASHHGPVLECAVCLSEFEDQDRGRVLPKCNHPFHVECIDPWFGSHSSCPLCRAPVGPDIRPETSPEIVIEVREPPVSDSEQRDCTDGCGAEMGCSESSPVGSFPPEWCSGNKPVDLVGLGVMEVSAMEMGSGSPESHRVMSLKRIWSV